MSVLAAANLHRDVAFATAFVGNNPAPAVPRDSAAIVLRPAPSTELVSDDLPVLHWQHDARLR